MKTLVLKNYFLWSFVDRNPDNGRPEVIKSLPQWLEGQMLHGKESRERTRFIKMVAPMAQEIAETRNAMIKDATKKNEKGEILYIDKDGKETADKTTAMIMGGSGPEYRMAFTDSDKLEKEITDYLNEDCIIDVTPANQATVDTVKNIVLDTRDEFSGITAIRYAEWCDVFQSIKEEAKPKKKV